MVEASQLTASDDEHDPEGLTIAFERSEAGALLAAATTHLADVDAALARIAAGGYGHCERCGQAVVRDRLPARPTARTCIVCAAAGRLPRRPPRGSQILQVRRWRRGE
jgi:RNA polymerase-binding transcription factor DksA